MFNGLGNKVKMKAIKKAFGFDSKAEFTWSFGHTDKSNEFVVKIESSIIDEASMKKMYNRFLKASHKIPFEAIDFSKDLIVPEKGLDKIKDFLLESFKPKRFVPKKYSVVFIFLNDVWFSRISDSEFMVFFEFVGVHQ